LELFKALDDADQSSSAIADLTKGIESYLENFKAGDAFQISFSELAKKASMGVGGYDPKANVLRDEYNL
jgi:hypothetical protein